MQTVFFFCWLIQGHDRHVVLSSSILWVKLLHAAQLVSARVSERCAWGVDCAFIWRIKGGEIPLTLIQITSEFYYLQLCGREPQHFSSCGWEAACSFYQANCCSTLDGLHLSNQLFYALQEGASPQVGQFSQILSQEGESFFFFLKTNIPSPTTTTTKPTDTKNQNELCKGKSEWGKREDKKEIGGACVQYQVTKELGWTIP